MQYKWTFMFLLKIPLKHHRLFNLIKVFFLIFLESWVATKKPYIHFTPFVCNSVGCFGASTKPLLNTIATLYAAKTGSAVHTLMQQIEQISFGAQYQQASNIILATSTAEFHRDGELQLWVRFVKGVIIHCR